MDASSLSLSGGTLLYLSLYLLTLCMHVILMSYVLAGTLFLAARALAGREPGALSACLREWLPFALGLAITAGVAPLLFLQLLYRDQFYTASLLLFHRFMALLPALIVGFYSLYLIKNGLFEERTWFRIGVRTLAAACFVFVAWAWTENHLLSLAQSEWVSFYEKGNLFYRSPQLAPRLLLWIAGAFPLMAFVVAWQLDRDEDDALRQLRRIAIAGLLVAAGAVGAYYYVLPPIEQRVLLGPSGRIFAGFAVGGAGLQLIAWVLGPDRGALWRTLATTGVLVGLLGVSVLREHLRWEAVDLAALAPRHERLVAAGGLWLFVLFFVLNAGAIAWVLRTVTRQTNEELS